MDRLEQIRVNVMATVEAIYARRPYSTLPRESVGNFVRNLISLLD